MTKAHSYFLQIQSTIDGVWKLCENVAISTHVWIATIRDMYSQAQMGKCLHGTKDFFLKFKWTLIVILFGQIDKGSQGYCHTAKVDDYLTIEEIFTTIKLFPFPSSKFLQQVFVIVCLFSMGENVLINVDPTWCGKIAPIFQDRLQQMSAWLQINGEPVYASVPWKYQNDTINSNIW